MAGSELGVRSITDTGADPAVVEKLRAAGVAVRIAGMTRD